MKNQKQTKKNNAAKRLTNGKATDGKPAVDMSHRAFSMADYRAMEKVAKSIETMCRIRRKYVAAMQTATECIDRNLDKLRAIVWGTD